MEVAKIGRRGQLTLPRKVRGVLKVKEKDRLFFISRGEEMVIKPLLFIYFLTVFWSPGAAWPQDPAGF